MYRGINRKFGYLNEFSPFGGADQTRRRLRLIINVRLRFTGHPGFSGGSILCVCRYPCLHVHRAGSFGHSENKIRSTYSGILSLDSERERERERFIECFSERERERDKKKKKNFFF